MASHPQRRLNRKDRQGKIQQNRDYSLAPTMTRIHFFWTPSHVRKWDMIVKVHSGSQCPRSNPEESDKGRHSQLPGRTHGSKHTPNRMQSCLCADCRDAGDEEQHPRQGRTQTEGPDDKVTESKCQDACWRQESGFDWSRMALTCRRVFECHDVWGREQDRKDVTKRVPHRSSTIESPHDCRHLVSLLVDTPNGRSRDGHSAPASTSSPRLPSGGFEGCCFSRSPFRRPESGD